MKEIYLETLEKNQEIIDMLNFANEQMKSIGYTEHGFRHSIVVAKRTKQILKDLNYDNHIYEMGGIAGLLHDLGNSILRHNHAETGAIIALNFMLKYHCTMSDAIKVASAIANHDERHGQPIHELAAALIIADKSDAHRSRVQDTPDSETFDIHDKVNASVTDNKLIIDSEKRNILLKMTIDQNIAKVRDYFLLFIDRVKLCEQSAKVLNATFTLNINGQDM
ncbi:MAG: HD domain-containing protein [Abditibacteriota bacterium]|nr:HD domain-containing protein [Abditibacteriota bacterium]